MPGPDRSGKNHAVFINPALDGKGEVIIGAGKADRQGDFVRSFSNQHCHQSKKP
jgi:hypothetical protein